MPALHDALRHTDIELVKTLLKQGADVEEVDSSGNKPLIHAVLACKLEDNLDFVLLLLGHQAEIHGRSQSGVTALHTAAWIGDAKSAYLLIKLDADPNAKDNRGNTPIHLAAQRGHLDVISLLVEMGADPNAKDNEGNTPLDRAAERERQDMATLLIELGADPNQAKCMQEEEEEAMPAPQVSEDFEAIHSLAEDKVRQPQVEAVGKQQEAQERKSQEEQPQLRIWDKLYSFAADDDDEQFFKAYKEFTRSGEFDPELRSYLLGRIAACGYVARMRTLLEDGADATYVDEGGGSPLHSATSKGSLEIVRMLVANGADVNVRNEQGRTPLHNVAHFGAEEDSEDLSTRRIEIARFLLDQNADINVRANDGATPLFKALVDVDIMNEMHRSKKWPAEEVFEKIKPRHKTMMNMAELFIRRGADVNARDNLQGTPIYNAVMYCPSELVELLLEHGANVQVQDEDGVSPVQLATKAFRGRVVKMIQEAEAKAQQAEAETKRRRTVSEEKVRQAEAEARQAQERQQRISAGQCVNCGKPLGFIDKMAKRQAHAKC